MPEHWRDRTAGWAIRALSEHVSSGVERRAVDLAMLGACLQLLANGLCARQGSRVPIVMDSETSWAIGEGGRCVYLPDFVDVSVLAAAERVSSCVGGWIVGPTGTGMAMRALRRHDRLARIPIMPLDDYVDLRLLLSAGDLGWSQNDTLRALIDLYNQRPPMHLRHTLAIHIE